MKLEFVAERMLSCQDEGSLISVVKEFSISHGFDNCVISTFSIDGPQLILGIAPNGWDEYYMGEECWKHDPVFMEQATSYTPHTWDSLINQNTPDDMKKFMDEAYDSGMRHGLTTSVRHLGKKLNVAISSRDNQDEGYEHSMLASAFAVTSMFATRRAMLHKENTWLELTKQETEVVKWIVAGKTNSEISLAMGINIKTVESYISRICIRNNLKGRLQISIQAILNGIVDIA